MTLDWRPLENAEDRTFISDNDFSETWFQYFKVNLGARYRVNGASLMAPRVNNPPAVQETQEMQVQFLGLEDPLEEEMATHSSILAWRIPQTEEPGGLQSMGSQRVRHD